MKKGVDFIGISVAYICHDGNGNYLMNKRSINCRDEHGTWDFGGGGLEIGEKVEDCLRKELKEEYGVEPIKHSFLGSLDVFRKIGGENTHWVALQFLVLVDREKVINGEPKKFEEIRWFKLNNLPKPLHSAVPLIFEKFKNQLS